MSAGRSASDSWIDARQIHATVTNMRRRTFLHSLGAVAAGAGATVNRVATAGAR